MERITKVVFFFPWTEVSGGPFFLTRLAEDLEKTGKYEVYYTDYENCLFEKLVKNPNIHKLVYKDEKTGFKVFPEEPVILVTPIYWACYVPIMHPRSRIMFFNWHNCCIPVLRGDWQVNDTEMNQFLKIVYDSQSVFFCDLTHWSYQNTPNLRFEKKFVPIILPPRAGEAVKELINPGEINIAVLGRICPDKVYSVIDLLRNLEKTSNQMKKNVFIIGDGPNMKELKKHKWKNGVHPIYCGTVTGKDLAKILEKKVDILFAMGTSVLEGAALKLPSVIIPHNVEDFKCNRYVYLSDSKGFALGWFDTQMEKLKLQSFPLQKIIDDVYVGGKKAKIGENCYQYYLENHTSNISYFQKALQETTLTYEWFFGFAKERFHLVRKRRKFGISVIWVWTNYNHSEIRVLLFKYFKFLIIKNDDHFPEVYLFGKFRLF